MHDDSRTNRPASTQAIVQSLLLLDQRVNNLTELLSEVHVIVSSQRAAKEWYTTAELAEAVNVSQHTVQERWCNRGRIDCEKRSGPWQVADSGS